MILAEHLYNLQPFRNWFTSSQMQVMFEGICDALKSSFKELNQWRSAEEAFRQAIRLEPESFTAWLSLGEIYCKQGNVQGVIEVHDRLRVLSAVAAANFFRDIVQKSGNSCKPEQAKKPST